MRKQSIVQILRLSLIRGELVFISWFIALHYKSSWVVSTIISRTQKALMPVKINVTWREMYNIKNINTPGDTENALYVKCMFVYQWILYDSWSEHCWMNVQLKLKRTIRNNGVGSYMAGKSHRTNTLKTSNTYLCIIKNVIINVLY